MWQERLPHVEKGWQDSQPHFEAAWQRERERIEAEWAASGNTPKSPAAFLANAEQQYFAQQKDRHFEGTYDRCLQDAAEIEIHGRIQTSGLVAAAKIQAPEAGSGVDDSAHHPPRASGKSRGSSAGL
jgi:hypothetical protein